MKFKQYNYILKATNYANNVLNKKGGPAHQNTIQREEQKLKATGYATHTENKVSISDGHKNTRFTDLMGKKGDEEIHIQVGRATKRGRPVAREQRALDDLLKAGKKVTFIPYNKLGIPVFENFYKAQCQTNKCYLFVVRQFETGCPTVINLEQAVYGLDEPTRKNTLGSNNKVYYTGDTDEYNNPLISAYDIISEFGDTKANAFYADWSAGKYTLNNT